MLSAVAILIGVLAIWAGIADKTGEVVAATMGTSPVSGYPEIKPGAFLIGLIAVTVPLFVIPRADSNKYIALIVLMFLMANRDGISSFSNFASTVYSGGG